MSTALRGLKGYSYCKLWKFFCSHLWPVCFAPGHKSKEKTWSLPHNTNLKLVNSCDKRYD